MSATLLIRLDGPLQSWGVASRYSRRETLDHPSKSGVIGLCAAALGRRRDESLEDLARLRHGVLVVDPGRIVEDYHTVSNTIRASRARRVAAPPASQVGAWSGAEIARHRLPRAHPTREALKTTEVTRRLYLTDALFVAGLEGERRLLEEIRRALAHPRFPLSLGRASCLPSAPLAFVERPDGGLTDLPLAEALRREVPIAMSLLAERRRGGGERGRDARRMRLIVECAPHEATIRVQDQPNADSFISRRFATRYATTLELEPADA